MYRVAILCPGQDTAGIGARLRETLLTHAEGYDVVAVRASETYLQFPHHVATWEWPFVERLVEAADLLHMHNHLLPRLARWQKRKPLVFNHHGTIFREDPAPNLAAADEFHALTVVSTLDLTIFRPDIRWLPGPINVDWLASLRAKYYEPSERIRIVHAPTNRAVKDTELFIATIRALKARGLPVEGILIEGLPWAECLRMKAKLADVLYDQLQLGYGQNSLEAWAMGIPVVAGADERYEAIMARELGELPYHRATPETLARRLTALVSDAQLRSSEGQRGHAYVRRWHDNPVVASRLGELYDEAAAAKGATRPPRLPSAPWPAPAPSAEPLAASPA